MKPLRIHDSNYVYFVTNRTHQGMFFMLPTKEINAIIRYWLTKAKHAHGPNMEIYAFSFLSNHFHILLRDPKGELPRFMCYLQGNLARAVNRHINRRGTFWHREYHDLILDTVTNEDVFWNRYCYTVLNPVKSGLVATGSQWKGVGSLCHALENKPIVGTGIDRTRYGDKKRHNKHVNKKDFEETFSFEITPPPFIASLKAEKQKTHLTKLFKSAAHEYRKKRLYKPAMGMRKVLKQSFFHSPSSLKGAPKRSPRIRFMTFCKKAKDDFNDTYGSFVLHYKHAVHLLFIYYNTEMENKFVSIETQFPWPWGCYPPTKHKPIFM